MYLKFRYSYMTLLASSTLVVCTISLFLLSSTENLIRLSFRSENSFYQPTFATGVRYNTSYDLANSRHPEAQPHSRTLGVASHIYVLSLPRRRDRRRSMNALSRALDLHFEYEDGVEPADASVDLALDTLRRERRVFRRNYYQNSAGVIFPGFAFPSLKDLEHQESGKINATNNTWFNGSPALPSPLGPSTAIAKSSRALKLYDNNFSLPCATPEDPFPAPLNETEVSLLPPWRILSRGMVACWMGHLRIIRKIANLPGSIVAIVLEDDVDMEFDIERRLRGLWSALPSGGWDVIMLGYCHSDEMAYPPLAGAVFVRPSFAPKCTHAYALSRFGARRLYQILVTRGFAFSRALDQAISWLIRTNEIRSYSIVPAIVVQSKDTRSDIWHTHSNIQGQTQNSNGSGDEKGSKWRDVLMDSTLDRVKMEENGRGAGNYKDT